METSSDAADMAPPGPPRHGSLAGALLRACKPRAVRLSCAKGSAAMLKLDNLVHFTIPVKELDRSEKFYTEILGLKRIRRNDHMVFMRAPGDTHFVLTYSENPVDPNKGDKHEIHTAFQVSPEEYERAKAFLASKNIMIFKEEDRRSGTFHGRSAYFHDPDRNVIEIIDLTKPPQAEADD
jgi:catechol 2,3-dioxygenase-like lactoylglutathione lyase family enzyme